MSTETLQQMKDRWALLMAATHSDGPNKGRRVFETDPKYARDVTALSVQIAEREQAEASRPQLSEFQAQQLAWLGRAEGARDKSGAVVSQQMTEHATAYRRSLHQARTAIFEGRDISSSIASTERDMVAKGWTLGAPPKAVPPGAARLMPLNSEVSTDRGGQPINTLSGAKASG